MEIYLFPSLALPLFVLGTCFMKISFRGGTFAFPWNCTLGVNPFRSGILNASGGKEGLKFFLGLFPHFSWQGHFLLRSSSWQQLMIRLLQKWFRSFGITRKQRKIVAIQIETDSFNRVSSNKPIWLGLSIQKNCSPATWYSKQYRVPCLIHYVFPRPDKRFHVPSWGVFLGARHHFVLAYSEEKKEKQRP